MLGDANFEQHWRSRYWNSRRETRKAGGKIRAWEGRL